MEKMANIQREDREKMENENPIALADGELKGVSGGAYIGPAIVFSTEPTPSADENP